jgi:peptidoglycan/xylan/chitin deacetylase (PgdA/CDA1 family)
MSFCRKVFCKIQRELCRRYFRTVYAMPKGFKGVSFSFDDFPGTAVSSGARILEEYNARGTFYLCQGLMEQDSPSGRIASLSEIQDLLARGHEIGCHTHDHLDCDITPAKRVKQDCINSIHRGHERGLSLNNFAYPKGGMSFATKAVIKKLYASARSNRPEVNRHKIDMHSLNAFPIYDKKNKSAIFESIDSVNKDGGWVIFYTHDVSTPPSRYGTSESLFREIIERCVHYGLPILTIDAAIQEIKGKTA